MSSNKEIRYTLMWSGSKEEWDTDKGLWILGLTDPSCGCPKSFRFNTFEEVKRKINELYGK
jgi:hypothetical protein